MMFKEDKLVVENRTTAHNPFRLWWGLVIFMLLVGLYFIARYNGQWTEGDSSTFTGVIRAVANDGKLIPSDGPIYPNGFAYQAISTFLLDLGGFDVIVLQQLVYPLLACLLVPVAWMLYKDLTLSAVGATLATLLLVLQPEFLFVILRSSHEKFTRLLMLLALFWLVRSFGESVRRAQLITYVTLFYLTVFALITSNNLLAHSFVFAIAMALMLRWLFKWRKIGHVQENWVIMQRLSYAVIVSLGLNYLFTFYAYAPASHDILVLRNIWDQVSELLLDVQNRTVNAYTQVQAGWVNLPVYFLLSVADWLILAASLIIWLRQGLAWLQHRSKPETSAVSLLWLFYSAFVAQGVLSVLVDASGALSTNLQLRAFPSFSIVAAAMVGSALARWRLLHSSVPVRAAFAGLMSCIAILSVLKATNEPLLSNKWVFYKPGEVAAVDWGATHLVGSSVWTDFDERLDVAYTMIYGSPPNSNVLAGFQMGNGDRDAVLSTIIRLRSTRLQQALPVPPDALQVYDNGQAQFYHLRPETPFQR